jgi:hypothetical protein
MFAIRWNSARMTLGALATAARIMPAPHAMSAGAIGTGLFTPLPAIAYAEKRRMRARPGLRGHKYRL